MNDGTSHGGNDGEPACPAADPHRDTVDDSAAAAARRAAFAADVTARTGIDEAMIERVVHAFYAAVRADPLLSPVFAARIGDWQPHLARMCAFWSSVVLMSGQYHGRPMPMHATLPVSDAHFTRWLELFGDTARALCPPAAADLFIDRADLIAANLSRAVAIHQGHATPPVARLVGMTSL